MRLFIGIRITDEIIQKIIDIQEKLSAPDLRVKWVEPYNLHVTLKFIGEVDETIRGVIENIMQGICRKQKPFNLSFQGLGVFPNLQSPRIIWAGIGDGGEHLQALAEKLNDTFAILNVPMEQWQYTGHLTIGRVKGKQGIGSLFQFLRTLPDESLGSIKVNNMELIESKLSSSGPDYVVLKKVDLGG
ncbi:MAG: RNA 2',3'-cyclic phosphodiesterase [bacterium]